MEELDPRTLRGGQEIEVSDLCNVWDRAILRSYVPGAPYPWVVGENANLKRYMHARLPQPKRPELKPGDVVGLAVNRKGLFVGWDKHGDPLVAPADAFLRIKLSDGTWYPPKEEEAEED